MSQQSNDQLAYQILSLVAQIPLGKVATYGQLAQLIGREKNARLVGRILSQAENYGKYPCHRVVNHAGRVAPHWLDQPELLSMEGVIFRKEGYVDLKVCQWQKGR